MEKRMSSVVFSAIALAVCVFVMLAPTFFSVPSPFAGLGMFGAMIFLYLLAEDVHAILKKKYPRLVEILEKISMGLFEILAMLLPFLATIFCILLVIGVAILLLMFLAPILERCWDIISKILIIIDRMAA